MNLPCIHDVEDLLGKRVLVRADLNVPIEEGGVRNSFRIQKALRTISFLREKGAKVLVISHIGREQEESLSAVAREIAKTIPVRFVPELPSGHALEGLPPLEDGQVVLFENLRRDPREKENHESLSRELSALADLYVNDAFSASHRAHASIVGVPKFFPGLVYAGLQFADEVTHLARALRPESPSLFVLGGAKFETKVSLLRQSITHYDDVFVGGALAHDFFRAKGLEVGRSLVSKDVQGVDDLVHKPNLILPPDVVVQEEHGTSATKRPQEVLPGDRIMDCGDETVRLLSERIANAKMVVWNGPLGNYEEGFAQHTESLACELADASAQSIVGGGDTVASISRLGLEERFTFVSTGGGAMLDFLADGSLPGIDALLANALT